MSDMRHDAHYSWLPVDPATKRPLVPWKVLCSRLPTPAEVQTWKEHWPNAGIGYITGAISNLLVIDADSPAAIAEVEGSCTPTVKTPHGRHYYFQFDGRTGNRARLGRSRAVDVRGHHGYVVAPPTRGYTWMVKPRRQLLELPNEIRHMIGDDQTSRGGGVHSRIGGHTRDLSALIPAYLLDATRYPSRSEQDAAVALALIRRGASDAEVALVLRRGPKALSMRGGSAGYVARTVASARRWAGQPRSRAVIESAELHQNHTTGGRRLYLSLDVGGRRVRTGVTVPARVGDPVWARFRAFDESVRGCDLACVERLVGREVGVELHGVGVWWRSL